MRRCIGIDDALPPENPGPVTTEDQARSFVGLFADVYAVFCRKIEKRTLLTPESLAVLHHLQLAGPLTVSEAARHMERAQSVMSEIIDRLESKGLLCRIRDERDRRRVLVWLTPVGAQQLAEESQILSEEKLRAALAVMEPEHRTALLSHMRDLIRSALQQPLSKINE